MSFGRRYYGAHYFGPRYFGSGQPLPPALPNDALTLMSRWQRVRDLQNARTRIRALTNRWDRKRSYD